MPNRYTWYSLKVKINEGLTGVNINPKSINILIELQFSRP